MANSHILVGASTNPLQPVVRRISTSDLYHALARGYEDFAAYPSHALFLCVIYPLVGRNVRSWRQQTPRQHAPLCAVSPARRQR